jgi:hypothetical protein
VRSMPPILALYETRLTVSDLSRSIAFYRDDVGRRLFCSLTYMVCPQQVWAVEVSILDNLFESRRRTPADNWPTTVPLILDSEVKAFHPFASSILSRSENWMRVTSSESGRAEGLSALINSPELLKCVFSGVGVSTMMMPGQANFDPGVANNAGMTT